MARLTYEVPFVPNTITAYAYKDPWFALGNLIGRAWANNYNERGINKLIDSMEGAIPGREDPAVSATPAETSQNRIMENWNAANPLPRVGTGEIQGPVYTVGENVPGMLEAGNIDLSNRPIVRNPDGTISTVRSIGVNLGGKEYLLPTVSDDGKILSTDEAVQQFRDTGKHLGVFDSPEASTNYAQSLHNQQAQAYGGNPINSLNQYIQALNAPRSDLNYQQLQQVLATGQPLPMSDYSGLGQAIGQSQTDPQMMQNALADKNTNGVMDAIGQAAVNNGYDGLESSVGRAYGDVMNLRQNPAQAAAQQSAQQGQLQPFDMQNWIAQMKAEGRRQGRPDYQIDLAIERMMPNAQAYLDSYNKQQADGIEAGMYQALDSGDWGELNKGWLQLQQYDPNRAKAWGNTIPSLKDLYSTGAERENTILSNSLEAQRENQKHLNRMAEADNEAQNARRNAEFNKYLQNKYGRASSGSSGGSSGSGSSSGGGSPNQYQLMGNNMLNAAANVFRGADRDQIAKTTSDIVGFLEAIDEDPEKKAKYNPSILNMLQEAAYTGNALREYLDGHYESANQYSNAVSNANSYFAQFLPSNRIKQ